ncbi:hypothetical protein [Haladaptatus halobius]|jgi:hypothetical protein|uniref:hypothetical protein n=1 Tax=Haladaptatus halobius TaxID=2884875 RepID=UPI001D0B1107|nr:hypothetical protein [Haladaptatus halobius]
MSVELLVGIAAAVLLVARPLTTTVREQPPNWRCPPDSLATTESDRRVQAAARTQG